MYARCKNIMDIFCGEKHDQEKKECIKIVKNKTDYTLDNPDKFNFYTDCQVSRPHFFIKMHSA